MKLPMCCVMKRWGNALVLAVLLAAPVAHAQKVVVLSFEGDSRDKLRTQVEKALKKTRRVEVVSLSRYALAARRERHAMASLGIAAAVEGTVGSSLAVRVRDANGAELWSESFPVKRGLISNDNVRRLAASVAAAAASAKSAQPTSPSPEVSVEPAEPQVKVERNAKPSKKPEGEMMPGLDLSAETQPPASENAATQTEAPAEAVASQEVPPPTPESSESEEDEDLKVTEKSKVRQGGKVGPQLAKVFLAGPATWRSYCARSPDAKECLVDFSTQKPYLGAAFGFELFPLAWMDNPLKGLGVMGRYARGFSSANVRSINGATASQEVTVKATDEDIELWGGYRYHFGLGGSVAAPLVGWVGLRGGLSVRNFNVEKGAAVAFPSSHRSSPAVGVEASVPVARYVRIEAAGSYFLGPKPNPDDIASFGAGANGKGFAAEAGVAGDVYGPIGYVLRFKLASYKDAFTGVGAVWPQGGSAEETYSSLFLGVTASY